MSHDEDSEGKGSSGMNDTMMERRRSLFCEEDACVEVAPCGDTVLVRDGRGPAASLSAFRPRRREHLCGPRGGRGDLQSVLTYGHSGVAPSGS
ncbi:hypothetical protein Areg01_10290 [Actinoplanes regularis]|nr:hypothetical protein Areg01_10290 [Actinoplanes regularis]